MHITQMTKEQREAAFEKGRLERERYTSKFVSGSTQMQEIFQQVPPTYAYLYAKALSGELVGKKLIKLKCLECACFQKEEVKHCTVKTCPLWATRPYQEKA